MHSTFRGEKTFSRQPAFPGKVDTRIADAAQFEQMNGEKKPSAPYPSRAVFSYSEIGFLSRRPTLPSWPRVDLVLIASPSRRGEKRAKTESNMSNRLTIKGQVTIAGISGPYDGGKRRRILYCRRRHGAGAKGADPGADFRDRTRNREDLPYAAPGGVALRSGTCPFVRYGGLIRQKLDKRQQRLFVVGVIRQRCVVLRAEREGREPCVCRHGCG